MQEEVEHKPKLEDGYIQIEGELFERIQKSKIFRDSKTFVDSVGKEKHSQILERYRKKGNLSNNQLKDFVEREFNIPHEDDPEALVPEAVTMEDYIEQLWKHLSRPAHEKVKANSTLIPLEYPYVVPGGRFREIYYWDSYFTAEGLAACGQMELTRSLVKNISEIIGKFGFMPNGNRVYYLTRSHPPMFSNMLEILEREDGENAVEPFLDSLKNEYEFWMENAEEIESQEAHRRVVKTENGFLNRFYDNSDNPRPEAYLEDMDLTSDIEDENERERMFRNIRASCESGWDFSSRWLDEPNKLETIRTTEIIPVDLNAMMYRMESNLARWKDENADFYRERAEKRKEIFDKHFWNEEEGFYFDYNRAEEEQSDTWSLAATVPLFYEMSSQEQADAVAENLKEKFLDDGGLVTTLKHSGEQWDEPNGWAPLHWFAINGLLNYGHRELAQEIAERWIFTNRKMFKETGQMKEKYNVENPKSSAEDGEYIVQNGFRWTNGVAIALIENYLFNGNAGKLDTEPLEEN